MSVEEVVFQRGQGLYHLRVLILAGVQPLFFYLNVSHELIEAVAVLQLVPVLGLAVRTHKEYLARALVVAGQHDIEGNNVVYHVVPLLLLMLEQLVAARDVLEYLAPRQQKDRVL